MVPQNVVLFDGLCGLCNSWVNFLLRVDSGKKLIFSPLQGEFAKKNNILPLQKAQDTICYWDNGAVYTQSTAVIRILSHLNGIFVISKVMYLIPRVFRDACYNVVARYRYRVFGKRETCRLPTPEERSRFLA